MKKRIGSGLLGVLIAVAGLSFAMSPEVEHGKALFEDPALGGGTSGGLIGVTFKIEGTTEEPRLFINPLSAVAPGIFRKIFEFQ